MKKHLYLTMILLISFFSQAQKNYVFDYVLEYQYNDYTDKGNRESLGYTFINSKDNSYKLTVSEYGDMYHMMVALADGKYYFGTIVKEDFFVEAISFKCPSTGYKKKLEKIKNFKFENLSDTIIGTERYSHFSLIPLNKKNIKRYNQSTVHFLVENKYNFMLPFINPGDILYEMWSKGESIPNGVIKELYTVNKKNSVKLIQYIPARKLIIIDNDCK